ncbi:MAG: NAD(P)-dependent oxidoreductase [Spirochaetota bacterium]|nr:NAD(P)-dependent oxidoreductase [Spirochaetota bacterium]
MNIVITGATGMLGSHLAELCLSEGHTVLAIVRRNSPKLSNIEGCIKKNGFELLELNFDEYAGFVPGTRRADVFFHLAWNGVFGAARNEVQKQLDNIQYTIDAVSMARQLACDRFVFAGSNAEYGPVCEDKPLSPETPCRPELGYGVAKYGAGKLASLLCRQNNIKYNNIRCFQLYGKRDDESTFISYLISTIGKGERPSLTSCEQVYDCCYVKDADRAFLLVGEKGKDGAVYVLGSGNVCKLRSLVEKLRDIINPSVPLGFGEKQGGSNLSLFLMADISQLEADTGYRPSYSITEGFEDMLK